MSHKLPKLLELYIFSINSLIVARGLL